MFLACQAGPGVLPDVYSSSRAVGTERLFFTKYLLRNPVQRDYKDNTIIQRVHAANFS